MKIRNIILFIIILILVAEAVVFAGYKTGLLPVIMKGDPAAMSAIDTKSVNSTINIDGTVTAADQAVLHFQTGGKLTYLPFKEGDEVKSGQTIATLDSFALQKQLNQALNNYRSTRDTFDQTKENAGNNTLQGQQLSFYSNAKMDKNDAVSEAAKRILDQYQASLDNSVINVELANYAIQLATLTSPIDGILTHEDVNVRGVNVTPATSFIVADPESLVFRANVPEDKITFISEGSQAEVAVDGSKTRLKGTVSKIYPSKVTLPTGQAYYQIDIQSDDIKNMTKLDQGGTAIININLENALLVPAWVVLNGQYVWVDNKGQPEIRKVSTGKIHGKEIEITGGLKQGDKVITDPEYISVKKYQLL